MKTITIQQQKAAKLAGLFYLIPMAVILYATFGIHLRLTVAGNPEATAKNILANISLYRFGIICDLVYCAGNVILLAALYIILEPVNRTMALIATFWKLVYAISLLMFSFQLLNALQLINGPEFLKVFETNRLQALAQMSLRLQSDWYYAGLFFYSLGATVCAWLWFRSNYIPKILSLAGLISCAWCVICTVAFIIFPSFADSVNIWWFDTPMALFDITLSFWLLFKGLRKS